MSNSKLRTGFNPGYNYTRRNPKRARFFSSPAPSAPATRPDNLALMLSRLGQLAQELATSREAEHDKAVQARKLLAYSSAALSRIAPLAAPVKRYTGEDPPLCDCCNEPVDAGSNYARLTPGWYLCEHCNEATFPEVDFGYEDQEVCLMDSLIEFRKDCGKFRVGSDLAEKTAREINGYHLSRGCEHVACTRATAIHLLDDEAWIIMLMPKAEVRT